MSSEKLVGKPETDPQHGTNLHVPGAKADAGKLRPGLVLGGFARALKAVTEVGTYGAMKYTDNGWVLVENGIERYDDAKLRHWLDEKCGVECDKDTGIAHAAHEAWNSLARLDLMLREKEAPSAQSTLTAVELRRRALNELDAGVERFGPATWKGGLL